MRPTQQFVQDGIWEWGSTKKWTFPNKLFYNKITDNKLLLTSKIIFQNKFFNNFLRADINNRVNLTTNREKWEDGLEPEGDYFYIKVIMVLICD